MDFREGDFCTGEALAGPVRHLISEGFGFATPEERFVATAIKQQSANRNGIANFVIRRADEHLVAAQATRATMRKLLVDSASANRKVQIAQYARASVHIARRNFSQPLILLSSLDVPL